MRRRTVLALTLVAILPAIALVRTLSLGAGEAAADPGPPIEIDAEQVAASLAGAIRCRTVTSGVEDPLPAEEIAELWSWLEQRFPLAHARLARERIGDCGLLFTWKGSDAALEPVLLAAHLDVVPAERSDGWQHDPFAGELEGGLVHGRGALDDKGPAIALLSAVEKLLGASHAPARTVHLAFGGDEEIGGAAGAARIAAALAERGTRLAWVLDEGMAVTRGVIAAVDRPVALIGLAEKGYLTLELVAEAAGGHSSMPPRSTAIGRLSTAIARIEATPFPARIDGIAAGMLQALAPHAPFGTRLALANLWMLEPLVRGSLLAGDATAALLRTTTAVTKVEGGVKDNVLPTRASAVLNLRLHPRDTCDAAEARVRGIVAGTGVEVRGLPGGLRGEASAVSAADGDGFRALERAIRATWPEAIVAPGLVLGATDARHYAPVARDVYRFAPLVLEPADLDRIHGVDERIAVADLADAVRFYVRLLREL